MSVVGVRGSWWFRGCEQTAGTLLLTGRCARALVTRPFNWRREFVDWCYLVVGRTWMPIALSAFLFSYGVTLVSQGGTLRALGTTDRIGLANVLSSLREPAAWVTGMCIAGVAGTAICSDLGARRVREELDALAVLGVDPYRMLVLPRVLAITVTGPFLLLWAVFWWAVPVFVFAPIQLGVPLASVWHSFQTYPLVDLFAGLTKAALISIVVGVVSCYKGFHARGGPEGVGRAVNQAVVIAFLATWLISLLFNNFYLAAFPETQGLR